MKKFISLIFTVLLLGCAGGGRNDRNTNLRVINAVTDADALEFFLDFKPFINDVSYLESSGYSEVEVGSHKISVSASGSFTPLVDITAGMSDRSDYSLFVFGTTANPTHVFSRDDNDPPNKKTTKVRALNASSQNRSVDLYILKDTQSLNSSTPGIHGLSYKEISRYSVNDKGHYFVIVTNKDSQTVLASSQGDFSGNGVYTILIADEPGATKPRVLILKDH